MNFKKITATVVGLAVAGGALAGCASTGDDTPYSATPEAIAEATATWETDTASDTPFYTAETVSQKHKKYIEVIYDESQKTHWQNGGLVVGTYGHALSACQDRRFVPKADQRDCIYGASQWAKDTHQKMKGVKAKPLPKQPAKKAPAKKVAKKVVKHNA